MSLVTEEMSAWIGRTEVLSEIEVTRREIIKYSIATEQRLEKYRCGDEAPPMMLFGLLRPMTPLDELGVDGIFNDPLLPPLPLTRVMAGGSSFRYFRPIRAGDTLESTRELTDLVEKQGSQGPLLLIYYQMKVANQRGELVAEDKQTRIAR
jgi:hydroxyacyl-ACP dehydratase HTD2-like protein with hotdog domain